MSKRVNAVHYYYPVAGMACCGADRSFRIFKEGLFTQYRPSVTCKRCLQALAKADLEAYKAARQ